MKQFDSRDLDSCLPLLWNIDAAGWTRYRAAKDPLAEKVTEADGLRLAEAARARAERAFDRFGREVAAGACGRWAAELGVAVVDEPIRPGESPPFLSLAERKPARISLSAGALAQIGRTVEVHGLADKAGDAELWRRMLTAHELYHHLEWADPEAFRPAETVALWRLATHSTPTLSSCCFSPGKRRTSRWPGCGKRWGWSMAGIEAGSGIPRFELSNVLRLGELYGMGEKHA